jgi:hypothetical protein
MLNKSIDSIKRLKYEIIEYVNKSNVEKMKIYNHNGIEIDDSDISYLKEDQILYASLDGK